MHSRASSSSDGRETAPNTDLVLIALGMAIRRRIGQDGLLIQFDRGIPFSSWAFTQNVCDAGLAPSGEPSAVLTTARWWTGGF